MTAPKSLQGIFSTNNEPTCCVVCNRSVLLVHKYMECCGKVYCRICPNSFTDTRGKDRCASCNALSMKGLAALKAEARLGKAWAQHMLGHQLMRDGKYAVARKSFILSALQGNFYSFLSLSELYRNGEGEPRDLKLSEAFARKARYLYPDCGLLSNLKLLGIAAVYSNSGASHDANSLLLEILHEAEESALNGSMCQCVAARLSEENPHPAAQMYARAFCYGCIESAISASMYFLDCKKVALSKFWLDVACKTKKLYEISQVNNQANSTGSVQEILSWPYFEEERNAIRSDLREMRNSCGGCGGALSGERRKYCRRCRTYCYCNEDCQKRHWEDGHREECKEVEEHMHNILRAIRLGRFDWIQKME